MSISASRSLSIEETICLIQEIAKSVGATLKEKQLSALTSFCEGNNIFITLPTGYGKSMIFDLLPLVFDKRKYANGFIFALLVSYLGQVGSIMLCVTTNCHHD